MVEPDRHRPATATGERGGGPHIGGVDVGMFFAIHFDAHEMLIEHLRKHRVLERFVGHHMAPMACCVADRQEYWHVSATGLSKGLGTPRPPLHGIVCVLLKVGGQRVAQAVGHPSFSRGCALWREVCGYPHDVSTRTAQRCGGRQRC